MDSQINIQRFIFFQCKKNIFIILLKENNLSRFGLILFDNLGHFFHIDPAELNPFQK